MLSILPELKTGSQKITNYLVAFQFPSADLRQFSESNKCVDDKLLIFQRVWFEFRDAQTETFQIL